MTRGSLLKARLAVCVVAASLLVCGGLVADEDEVFDRTPVDCLRMSLITRTKALDDQNVIFYARGKRAYRNHLPQKCPGLERENRFSYTVTSGRLCEIDTITVLQDIGFGFQPGFTCRLGEFVPLSPEEIEDLESLRRGGPTQQAIEAKPVTIDRPPDADEAEPATPATPAERD